ncbi:unnamed protein product [Dovyalis caffra]|uniref:Uncharacterized protein n=1 Tax=Dovyalis caffra TaxID=77055 RepID=A0AAV1SJG4_9ROSI|nr:unnamed protein product [Dovyalis caffra]
MNNRETRRQAHGKNGKKGMSLFMSDDYEAIKERTHNCENGEQSTQRRMSDLSGFHVEPHKQPNIDTFSKIRNTIHQVVGFSNDSSTESKVEAEEAKPKFSIRRLFLSFSAKRHLTFQAP